MEDQLILTVDVGSSSVRASLYDRMGNCVSGTEAQLFYSFKVTSGGGVEMDADELIDLAARAIDGTLSLASDKADRIAAVATSTFWHSVLGVDQGDVPRPRYLPGPTAGPTKPLRTCVGGSTKPLPTAGPAASCTPVTCPPSCSGSVVTLRKPTPARSAGYRPASTFTVGSLGKRG